MPSSVKFIVGKNKRGKLIEVSCEPKKMFSYKNKQGLAKPDPYLTRVTFKRQVLDKYYSNPEFYSVQDGVLRGEDWYIPIDNNHTTYIMAYLGDLNNLPHDEQHYWRSYNIFEESPRMSNVAIARDFYCEFRGPDSADLLFKEIFGIFNEIFDKKNGWKLFKPLNYHDKHNLESLANLSINSQKQFDEGILRLAKILIDSINVKKISEVVTFNDEEEGSLDKLEKYFSVSKIFKTEELIKTLRRIQKLRSSGSAHRKDSNYEKSLKKVPGDSLQEKYSKILNDCSKSLMLLLK
ncbi:MAG TPA: hypothetical protein PLU71_04990 [Candidatus Dependentiae bacterium]|nr:hypothetical protein [Candidatus Dependentiae bacterium]HRQ63191.1 hypothetical protein [Candidatus Dependentiae bacterium]